LIFVDLLIFSAILTEAMISQGFLFFACDERGIYAQVLWIKFGGGLSCGRMLPNI
jgi:hypothetical protein